MPQLMPIYWVVFIFMIVFMVFMMLFHFFNGTEKMLWKDCNSCVKLNWKW